MELSVVLTFAILQWHLSLCQYTWNYVYPNMPHPFPNSANYVTRSWQLRRQGLPQWYNYPDGSNPSAQSSRSASDHQVDYRVAANQFNTLNDDAITFVCLGIADQLASIGPNLASVQCAQHGCDYFVQCCAAACRQLSTGGKRNTHICRTDVTDNKLIPEYSACICAGTKSIVTWRTVIFVLSCNFFLTAY